MTPASSSTAVSAPALRFEGLKVFVRGLTVEAEIGLYPHERGRTQPLVIDVDLDLLASRVDSIADTVNYEALALYASALAEQGHVDLVETFAQRLALGCLDNPLVLRARVRVEKPQALERAGAAGVEVVVTRDDGVGSGGIS